jgi:hypothetical protein
MSRPIQPSGTSTPWTSRRSVSAASSRPNTRSTGSISSDAERADWSRILPAASTDSSSTSEFPTGVPRHLKKLYAIAPPIMIRSATSRKRWITPILSFTFAPPSTSRRGRVGSSRTAASSVTSRSSRRPAYAGSSLATPVVVACAL